MSAPDGIPGPWSERGKGRARGALAAVCRASTFLGRRVQDNLRVRPHPADQLAERPGCSASSRRGSVDRRPGNTSQRTNGAGSTSGQHPAPFCGRAVLLVEPLSPGPEPAPLGTVAPKSGPTVRHLLDGSEAVESSPGDRRPDGHPGRPEESTGPRVAALPSTRPPGRPLSGDELGRVWWRGPRLVAALLGLPLACLRFSVESCPRRLPGHLSFVSARPRNAFENWLMVLLRRRGLVISVSVRWAENRSSSFPNLTRHGLCHATATLPG